MNPSDLPKDRQVSARANSELLGILKDRGYSVQRLLDYAVDKLLGPIKLPTKRGKKETK